MMPQTTPPPVGFCVQDLTVRYGTAAVLQGVSFSVPVSGQLIGLLGVKRQRQDHAAQGCRRAAAPHRAVPSGRRPAGESVHPQACADRQLYPAAERHLGLALGAGGRAYGLQPAAGGPAKPHRRHARRCGRGPAHRRSGQQGRAGLPDAERRREAALYSGAHDCRGCAAAFAGRAGQRA